VMRVAGGRAVLVGRRRFGPIKTGVWKRKNFRE
jgi:hypothetical protein